MTAADKILQKSLVGSSIDSKEWAKIQAGIRDRAFFSATVEDTRLLHAMRQGVADILKGDRDPSEVRRDLRAFFSQMGYAPAEAGTIKDLYTKRRLDIMLKTNCDQARGYVSHLRATTPGALLAFPAYELIRVEKRQMPRDWRARWLAGANQVHWQGVSRDTARMIALKTSPIWVAISAFGNPFPPFDFNSGMGLRDVPKSKCRELGLLTDDDSPVGPGPLRPGLEPGRSEEGSAAPSVPPFNGALSATVPPEAQAALAEKFGDQTFFEGNIAKWREVSSFKPGKPVSLPFKYDHVAVDFGNIDPTIACLVPTLLREGGKLETLDGHLLTAIIENGTLKRILQK